MKRSYFCEDEQQKEIDILKEESRKWWGFFLCSAFQMI